MHTPVEVLDTADLENAVRLIVAALARIRCKEDFLPV
jgi:putative aminopeptidase FrvX